MKKGNYIIAGIFSALGVFVIVQCLSVPKGRAGIPGPGMVPIMVSVLMIVASISLLISTLRMTPAEDVALGLLSEGHKRVYVCMAILVLYLIAMPQLGFCVTSFVLLFGLIKWFGNYRYWVCAVVSAFLTGIVFGLFSEVLHVPLRFGLLF